MVLQVKILSEPAFTFGLVMSCVTAIFVADEMCIRDRFVNIRVSLFYTLINANFANYGVFKFAQFVNIRVSLALTLIVVQYVVQSFFRIFLPEIFAAQKCREYE